jgi:membrane associated rhomboid family serine protease
MIAIPVTKKLSWRDPPVVTLAIILINVLVLFILQSGDEDRISASEKFYFESGLAKIEIPLYLAFLEKQHPQALDPIDATSVDQDSRKRQRLYDLLQYDAKFQEALNGGGIIFGNPGERDRWLFLHPAYEKLRRRIVSLTYGFRPARPRAVTWLTAMFLHGGIGHLIGNMIFLWLVGCLIEYGLRRWLFAAVYLLGGFAATGFFWLLNSTSLVPLIGASGAIAAIMGAFTVFYGFKRVRLFFSLGFYFNYVKFPAIVMLPLWVGNELLQMLSSEGSHVAYAAHLGGLAGGAMIALIVRRMPALVDMEGFEDVRDDPVQTLIEQALAHMGELDYVEARKLLVEAERLQPDEGRVLQHLFTIDRQEPGLPRFHQTAQKLLNSLCQRPSDFEKAARFFREYIRTARPARLAVATYLRLCHVFCVLGKPDEARQMAFMLVRKYPKLEELPSTLLKLASAFAKKEDHQASQKCLQLLCEHYPLSSEAGIAKTQFRK